MVMASDVAVLGAHAAFVDSILTDVKNTDNKKYAKLPSMNNIKYSTCTREANFILRLAIRENETRTPDI